MADLIKILIVENDPNDIKAYTDTIRTINKEKYGEVELVATVKENKVDGLKALKEADDWSAAFIDLKLSTGDILNSNEGNEIVEQIYSKRRFPVFVLTNTPADVDEKFKESIFLRKSSKDGMDYYDVFNEIIAIHKTGILNILGKRGKIEEMLDEIFWKNISQTLDQWYNIKNSEKSLLRHTLAHLLEYLDISEVGDFDTYYTHEAYIFPSIRQHAFTGDIVETNGDPKKQFIVLTPACDLALHFDGTSSAPKTDRVLLAEIETHSDNMVSSILKKVSKTEAENDKRREEEKLMKLITNNYAGQFFYLPSTKFFGGGLVNFRKLHTLKVKDYYKEYTSICNLSSQFVKDIIARFSFYYARQGAPDFDFASVLKKHLT